MRAFEWCQNQRPWMTLNGHYALCFKIHAFSEPTAKTWMKIDPYYQQRRSTSSLLVVWVSDPSFWQHKVYADIRGGFPGEGRQMTMGLSKRVIFSTFARYFSEALVVRPTLLYSRLIIQSLAVFTLTPKYMKGHFTFNSVLSCQVKFKICFFRIQKAPLHLF